MRPRTALAVHLSNKLLDCQWTRAAMQAALMEDMPNWLDAGWAEELTDELIATVHNSYAPPQRVLARTILKTQAYRKAWRPTLSTLTLDAYRITSPRMQPAPALINLDIPAITTTSDLTNWLGISPTELTWLASLGHASRPSKNPKLQNYTYSWHRKSASAYRLLEAPKRRLKFPQRQILREILNKLPAHPASHGFVRGRSCITGASLHAGEQTVVTMDLKDFFPSIQARRIHGLFRTLGYPYHVAQALTGLVTTKTPQSICDLRRPAQHGPDSRSLFRRLLDYVSISKMPHYLQRDATDMFKQPHLPQGAPTSPALANLCAWKLDQRLSGLASSMNANYTRYADDLAFSGSKQLATRTFTSLVRKIAREEGFQINESKTKTQHRSGPQKITGVIVNDHMNVDRRSYDRLKATLHNCLHKGPASQNRNQHPDFKAHLEGRIAWVAQLNPKRARKLYAIFDRIRWD